MSPHPSACFVPQKDKSRPVISVLINHINKRILLVAATKKNMPDAHHGLRLHFSALLLDFGKRHNNNNNGSNTSIISSFTVVPDNAIKPVEVKSTPRPRRGLPPKSRSSESRITSRQNRPKPIRRTPQRTRSADDVMPPMCRWSSDYTPVRRQTENDNTGSDTQKEKASPGASRWSSDHTPRPNLPLKSSLKRSQGSSSCTLPKATVCRWSSDHTRLPCRPKSSSSSSSHQTLQSSTDKVIPHPAVIARLPPKVPRRSNDEEEDEDECAVVTE